MHQKTFNITIVLREVLVVMMMDQFPVKAMTERKVLSQVKVNSKQQKCKWLSLFRTSVHWHVCFHALRLIEQKLDASKKQVKEKAA